MTAELVVQVDRLWPEGTLRVPAGTCPGCAGDSHPGWACDGKTTDQVIRILWPDQRLVAPTDDPR